MKDTISKLVWGKSTGGTVYHRCIECGTNSKKHRGNGLCETCYGRAKDKRREQRRKEQRKNDKLTKIEELKNGYKITDKLMIAEEAKFEQEIKKEKAQYPLITEYIDYLYSKINYFPSFEVVCPICETKYYYEKYRAKAGARSLLTHPVCPKCEFDPSCELEQICWICQKRLMEWGENYCSHCKPILSKKPIGYFQKYCSSCNKPVDWDNCHWSFPFEENIKKMIQICDDCKNIIDQKKNLASPEYKADYFKVDEPARLNWLKVDNGELCGISRPYLSLFFLTPNYALQYLRKVNYRDKNLVLNLLAISQSSLRATDITFSPPKVSFAFKHRGEILERFDRKVLMWEQKNQKSFVRNYLSTVGDKIISNDNFLDAHLKMFGTELKELLAKKVVKKNPYETDNGNVIFSMSLNNLISDEFVTATGEILIECENEVRFENDLPEKGMGWISEATVFQEVNGVCKSLGIKAEHNSRPAWLGLQHLDVYVPSKKIAIEYQGIQHFKPISFFGGAVSLKETQDRDRKKEKLCNKNNVRIFYINETDSENEVRDKMNDIFELLKA